MERPVCRTAIICRTAIPLSLCLAPALTLAQVDFAPASDYDLAGAGPQDIVVAHFNADNIPDLAVTSAQGDGKITVLLGDSTGSYADDHPFTVGWSAWGIASGDLDGDRIADLVATDGNSASTAVYLFKGDGNGGFTALGSLAAGSFPTAVVVGHLDADQHADLAVASAQGGISVFAGTGGGGFATPSSIADASSLALQDLSSAFLNDDQVVDLLTPQAAFLGDGQGGFSRSANFGGELAVASGKLNADTFADVVVITDSQVQVWLGNGDGSFSFASLHTPGGTLSHLAVADLNRDGIDDVVLSDTANDRVAVLLASGGGGLSPAQYFATGSQPRAVASGHWNDDELADLAVPYRNFGDTARISILLQTALPGNALIFSQGFE